MKQSKSGNDKHAAPPPLPVPASGLVRAFPWVMTLLVVAYLASKTMPRAIPGPMDLSAAALTPVSYEGRIQPLDSLARNELLIMSKVTTLRSDWLRPSQVKDWRGLAQAVVDAGKAEAPSPGKYLWDKLADEQRKLLADAAGATETSPQAQASLLQLFNSLLDDEMRIDRVRGGIARGTLDETTRAWRFYDKESWKGVEIDAEQKDALDKLAAFDKHEAEHDHDASPAGHTHPKRPLTRPQVIDLNRRLLTAAFPGQVKAATRSAEPAIVWFMDVVADPNTANAHRIFRIEHERVLELLGLEARPGNFRYAIDEFRDRIQQLDAEANLAARVPKKERDSYQSAITKFAENLTRYMALAEHMRPHWVPPPKIKEDWKNFEEVAAVTRATGVDNPDAVAVATFLQAYRQADVKKFNDTVAAHNGRIALGFESDWTRANYETFFNRFDVFDHLTKLYVVVFLLVAASWALFGLPHWALALRRTAFVLMAVLAAFHLFGMASRSYLMDRPFVMVTNLYASAVFIGICSIIVALIIEKVQKLGIATAVAACIGFLTGIVALHLRADGDTLEMQQAVLDTNFWLATHVTTVTFGYAATYLAGALAIAYIIGGVFTNSFDKDIRKTFGIIIYGVICFALFLSFIGTVLGGIWADQSWGRFWGWDPKENGAVMIVIWNALILHARWAGMVQARGIAVLAIVGNIVTTWSWFGTNQLGAGLHSYGFMDEAVFWIVVFVLSQLLIMAVGVLPTKYWRSHMDLTDAPPSRIPAVVATGLLLAGAGLAAAMMIR